MGNCQAIDNASLVIQYPCGRVDRLYSPVPASQIMKLNPGHYVALLLTTTTTNAGGGDKSNNNNNKVRITRIKLLRATDNLAFGHAYRLITTREVMKGLCAKKYAKMKKMEPDQQARIKEKAGPDFGIAALAPAATGSELKTNNNQVSKNERNHRRTTSASASTAKSRGGGGGWHPSLQSISEAAGS